MQKKGAALRALGQKESSTGGAGFGLVATMIEHNSALLSALAQYREQENGEASLFVLSLWPSGLFFSCLFSSFVSEHLCLAFCSAHGYVKIMLNRVTCTTTK